MERKCVTAKEIADLLGGIVWGDETAALYGVALPKDSDEGMLTFFSRNVQKQDMEKVKFSACIVSLANYKNDGRTYIVVTRRFDQILHIIIDYMRTQGLYDFSYGENCIADTVCMGQNVCIGRGVAIGAGTVIENNVVIGSGVHIGDNCVIRSNVTIHERVAIGSNAIIQSGVVIGSDSFEYDKAAEYQRIFNVGSVIIEDFVEIGANTTIDRGTIGNTTIGYGTKIDNLVHIAHEVRIGKRCKICAQCGIAGWSVLDDDVVLYGKVGVRDGVTIGQNAVVLGMSGVTKNIRAGSTVSGVPAQDNQNYLREKALLRKLIKTRRS